MFARWLPLSPDGRNALNGHDIASARPSRNAITPQFISRGALREAPRPSGGVSISVNNRVTTPAEKGSLRYKRYDMCARCPVRPPCVRPPRARANVRAVHVTRQRPLHPPGHPQGMPVGVRCRHRPSGGVADGIVRHEHLPQLWQRARAIAEGLNHTQPRSRSVYK